MAENKRTPFQIQRDQYEIAELYLRGKKQHVICDELNRRRQEEYEAAVKAADEKQAGEEFPSIICANASDEIPKPYTLTRQQITYDLKAIQTKWLERTALNLDAMKAETLAKIDALEAYAWSVLEEYSGKIETEKGSMISVEVTGDIPGGARVRLPAKRMRREKNIELLTPDAKWGNIIDRCIERRCKMLGLDAPTEIDFGKKTRESLASLLGVSPEDLPETSA
jgi:hypothetical protein